MPGKYPEFRFILYTLTILVVISLMIGCSKGSRENPLEPKALPSADDGDFTIPDAIRTSQSSFEGLLGVYSLKIDTRIPSAELMPLRLSSTLGEAYQIDITNFLAVKPCTDCVRIKAVEMESDQTLTLHIAARHPFGLPADINNPTDYERLDLHIFDVIGILISEGTDEFPKTTSDFNGDGLREEEVITARNLLTNADGYTSIHDAFYDTLLPTTANIHPFKMFAYNPSEGNYNPPLDPNNGYPYLDVPTGHNVFPQGSVEYVVQYNLNLPPVPQTDFIFALSAAWGQGAQGRGSALGKRNNPRYFLPEFNRKEPYNVSVEVKENTLTGNTPTSSAKITVKVMDWQHNGIVDPDFDFYTTPLNRLSRQSNVKETTIEIPDMDAWYDKDNLPPPTGNGTATNPLTYNITIYNSALLPEGIYFGLVAARDDLEGQNLEMGIERDGVTKFKITDFTTYQIFQIPIVPSDNPPIACMTTIPSPPQLAENAQPIRFDGSCSTDDGTIVSYEWDLDYSGNPSSFHTDYNQVIVNYSYPRPGFYVVALRVTDNHVPPQKAVTSMAVSVFCTSYPAPSCLINQVPSWIVTSHNDAWTAMDGKFDFAFLSDGRAVIEDNQILGTSPVTPSGNANFTKFLAGYPNVNVGSIDVDTRNRVIWVEYQGTNKIIIGSVKNKNDLMSNRVHVFDTVSNTEIASVSLAQFGSHIQAVDTDQTNNVWAIMNNDMIVRLRSSDYTITETNSYSLDEITGVDIGEVFDMAINFHNDCFYILTNSNDKGALWRFECDMSYQSIVNGNPNPLAPVFNMVGGFELIEMFEDDALADIEIDNFSGTGFGTPLTGQQDCQIIMCANGLAPTTQIFIVKTIADANLKVLAREAALEGYGTHAIGIKPDGSNLLFSIVYGNDPYIPPGCSDKEMDVYSMPAGWM